MRLDLDGIEHFNVTTVIHRLLYFTFYFTYLTPLHFKGLNFWPVFQPLGFEGLDVFGGDVIMAGIVNAKTESQRLG